MNSAEHFVAAVCSVTLLLSGVVTLPAQPAQPDLWICDYFPFLCAR